MYCKWYIWGRTTSVIRELNRAAKTLVLKLQSIFLYQIKLFVGLPPQANVRLMTSDRSLLSLSTSLPSYYSWPSSHLAGLLNKLRVNQYIYRFHTYVISYITDIMSIEQTVVHVFCLYRPTVVKWWSDVVLVCGNGELLTDALIKYWLLWSQILLG